MMKDVNANVKSIDKKGKAKETDLRDVIRKYLENPTNSESAVNTIQDHKEETKNIKAILSQNERKEEIDSKKKIVENVTDSTDARKALNCQNVSQDEEKCVNIFKEVGETKILPGHATNEDRNRENSLHVESPVNQFRNTDKLSILGALLKVANLDVSMEGTTEMIGKDIAAKLNEPRVDMVVALVGVIGTEAAFHIFKETLKVEAGGGLMIKNGARRRTAGGTFFQLIREMRSPNIDMEKVNAVFEMLNQVEKMDSECFEKKGSVKLDRPCDYFNDTGICKFKSDHFSQSGFTRRIHSCRFCFYRHEVENSHPEIHCRLYRSYFNSLDSTFQSKEERSNKLQNGDVSRQSKVTAIEKILKEEHSNKLRNGEVSRQSKATAIEKVRSNKLQNVSRESKATATEKILTGSNAVPIGVRSRPTEEKKRHRGTVEQENVRSNLARSASMSEKAGNGMISQIKQLPPSTGQAPSAIQHSSLDVRGTEIDRATQNVIRGNGCQRSKKMVQFQNSFEREEDMKNAKEKLTMLSDQISKSVFKENQDYQEKKELKLVEADSSVGKSVLTPKTDELTLKNNMDCKIESQNSKEKRRKGKSCGKCLDKIPGKVKQGEISEKNVENKNVLQDANRVKSQNIDVEKQEVNGSAEDKHHNKAKLKEKCEKKKEIVKNGTIEDAAEENEKKAKREKIDIEKKDNPNLEANKLGIFAMKPSRKENYHRNIIGEGSGSKKEDDKEQTQIAAVNESEKKQGNTFEENKKADRNIDKRMQKSETKLSNSKTDGDGNRKQKLHCPCPPYCPNCLNIVKMKNLG